MSYRKLIPNVNGWPLEGFKTHATSMNNISLIRRQIPSRAQRQTRMKSNRVNSMSNGQGSIMPIEKGSEKVVSFSTKSNNATGYHEQDKIDFTNREINEESSNSSRQDRKNHTCQNHSLEKNRPLPPPLPEPRYSFHRRVLPSSLIQISSSEGKKLFRESLQSKAAESFFPLSEQFLNQSDPAYCGITTLMMILNAFGIDPNVRWKGGWRWYGSEDMILDSCCVESERVKRVGITMEEYQSLGRCQGLHAEMKRPFPINKNSTDGTENASESEYYSIESFREDIKTMVQNPPLFENDSKLNRDPNNNSICGGGFIVVSFERSSLGQTGAGHFSPIAAYHEETDRCLVMDVARFKYGPYWVKVPDLYESMRPIDLITKKSRGWFLNYHSPKLIILNNDHGNGGNIVKKVIGYKGSKATDEFKRPAEVVPTMKSGSNTDVCPISKIKLKYCSVGKK